MMLNKAGTNSDLNLCFVSPIDEEYGSQSAHNAETNRYGSKIGLSQLKKKLRHARMANRGIDQRSIILSMTQFPPKPIALDALPARHCFVVHTAFAPLSHNKYGLAFSRYGPSSGSCFESALVPHDAIENNGMP